MKILVSVRDAREARQAARAGVDFIDLKDPSRGALGGLPPPLIAELVRQIRADEPRACISATVGDWAGTEGPAALAQARAVAACGVDHVKVGVAPGPHTAALLQALGELQAEGLPIVPVFLADQALPAAWMPQALGLGFAAVMLDTQDKRTGSLLARWPMAALTAWVRAVQASGTMAGLAGALRQEDGAELLHLAPDFAGFRSAVCAGDRAGALDGRRLQRLLAALSGTIGPPAVCGVGP